MSGVAAVLSALVADADLLALVPVARIQAGTLPVGTPLPALSVTLVSSSDRNIVAPSASRFVRERVQVTVMASNFPAQQAIIKAVRGAAADRVAVEVSGLAGVTIHTDGRGADQMSQQAGLFIGTQDFRVTYSEER